MVGQNGAGLEDRFGLLVLSRERCPSGLRSATGNRVRAERCVAGSNPALSATKARDERAFVFAEAEREGFEPSMEAFTPITP
jgi:hypothetical protein